LSVCAWTLVKGKEGGRNGAKLKKREGITRSKKQHTLGGIGGEKRRYKMIRMEGGLSAVFRINKRKEKLSIN